MIGWQTLWKPRYSASSALAEYISLDTSLVRIILLATSCASDRPNALDEARRRIASDELPQTEYLDRIPFTNHLRLRPKTNTLTKTERKHRRYEEAIKQNELVRPGSYFLRRRTLAFGNSQHRSDRTEQTDEFQAKLYRVGTAERPPNSLSGLHERLLRIPQETKETSGTLGSEVTVRTGSWTTRPFLPTEQRNVLSACPSSFASLSERRRNWTKPNQFKVVVRSKTKTPVRVRISAEARWLAFPLGFVRTPG